MSLSQIHPVIIARNAAPTLEATLASLAAFPEVVVYDNGSTDATLDICRRAPNVRLLQGPFYGFGRTKRHASNLAAGDFVLSLDADEIVSAELLAALDRLDLERGPRAYALNRHNLLLGKHVRRGGWGDNWLVRLFDRRVCGFDDAPVHEKVVLPAGAGAERVEGPLWHQAVTDIDQFLQKISFYSELGRGTGRRLRSPLGIAVGAAWAFFRSYVLQAGWLEGWRGLVIANCEAQGSFFKHMKRYADAAGAGADAASPAGDTTGTAGDMAYPREPESTACSSARIDSAIDSGESAPISSPTGPLSRARNDSPVDPSASSSRARRAGGPSTPR